MARPPEPVDLPFGASAVMAHLRRLPCWPELEGWGFRTLEIEGQGEPPVAWVELELTAPESFSQREVVYTGSVRLEIDALSGAPTDIDATDANLRAFAGGLEAAARKAESDPNISSFLSRPDLIRASFLDQGGRTRLAFRAGGEVFVWPDDAV